MRKFMVLTLMLILATVMGFAQQQPVSMGAAATAEVGHGTQASVHADNWVTLEWRHCQAYQKVKGHLFWKRTVVDTEACAQNPETLFKTEKVHNLVTNAGFTAIEKMISDTAAQPAACNYIAVTNTAITPGATDTTLSGEIASNGLTRAQGTFAADTPGAKQYTVTKVFSASGTQASQATGLFNASSTGTMCYEATYSPVTVNNLDTLTVTWTVTLSRMLDFMEQVFGELAFAA